ncbi:MAG: metallophosphoesterase, partial [Candidatus Heimdallarchaeota archaeon]
MDSVLTIFRILALADVHGNAKAVSKLLSCLQREKEKPNLVIIAGDLPETTPIGLMLRYILTHGNLSKTKYTRWVYKEHGRPLFIQRQINSVKVALTLLGSLEVPIVYVPGNVDCHETLSLIKTVSSPKIHFLNPSAVEFGSIRIIGVGGSQFSAQRYREPLCDMEIYRDDFLSQLAPLYKIVKRKTSFVDILLTHEPPAFRYYTKRGIIIGGSKAISDLITHLNP